MPNQIQKTLTPEEYKNLQDYRTHLVAAEQKNQEEYDKTVITLSGGALGVTFAFIKDIVGTNPISWKTLIVIAWISWGASVIMTLASYFLSHLALRQTISNLDNAIKYADTEEIYNERAGGNYSIATAWLNAGGGILFFVGVILTAIFVWLNFGG